MKETREPSDRAAACAIGMQIVYMYKHEWLFEMGLATVMETEMEM